MKGEKSLSTYMPSLSTTITHFMVFDKLIYSKKRFKNKTTEGILTRTCCHWNFWYHHSKSWSTKAIMILHHWFALDQVVNSFWHCNNDKNIRCSCIPIGAKKSMFLIVNTEIAIEMPFSIYRSHFVCPAISVRYLLEKCGFHYQFRNLILFSELTKFFEKYSLF